MGPRKLSARAYAQLRAERGLPGTSHVAVLKAIKAGRLAGAFERRGRRILIDPDLADVAWVANTDTTEADKSAPQEGRARGGRPKRQRRSPSRPSPEKAKPEPAPEPVLPDDSPSIEFPTPEPGDNGETGALFGRDALPDEIEHSDTNADPKRPTMALANASKVAWQAELSRLQVLERQGVLVRASEVATETDRIFRTLRDLCELIPNRIDATLAASSDPVECRRILTQEIQLAFTAVSSQCSSALPVKVAG